MSSDIGLVCYENGDFGALSAALVRQVLDPHVTSDDEEVSELSFPDGGGGEMEPIEEGEDGFDLCIGNASGEDLMNAMFEIMRQTHTVMWWSGGESQITADPHIADHLPPGFVEEHGEPVLVRSGADILAEIEGG
jgi:hypothetical protein